MEKQLFGVPIIIQIRIVYNFIPLSAIAVCMLRYFEVSK